MELPPHTQTNAHTQVMSWTQHFDTTYIITPSPNKIGKLEGPSIHIINLIVAQIGLDVWTIVLAKGFPLGNSS
jgi:hypothetical protein